MNAPPIKVHWLVPYPLRGSGGHRTIFAHVRNLVKRGYECAIHVQERDPTDPGSSPRSAAELERMIGQWFFPTGARVVASWHRLEPCDILFGTLWETAPFVQRAQCAPLKAYFVQDFEAWFNPMGDGYIAAENTYRLGLEHITIGRFLTHLIRTEYGGSANFFDFTADEKIYRPNPALKTPFPSVAFLYQPEKPRRCPMLGREVLGIVKHHVPEAKIYLYGSDAPIDLWFEHENLGLITPAQCAALYQKAHVGLCISSSNPSRIPFEMMAAGCAVVDLARPNNFYDYDEGAISLVEASPTALAWKIIELLRDQQARERQIAAGLKMMAARPARLEFDRFAELVKQLHETGTVSDGGEVRSTARAAAVSAPADAAPPRRASGVWNAGAARARNVLAHAGRRTRYRLRHAFDEDFGTRRASDYESLDATVRRMAAGKRVVGFDVFDTLLLRRIEPDVVKQLVARRLADKLTDAGVPQSWRDLLDRRAALELELCRENVAKGLDDEFDYRQMVARWLRGAGADAALAPEVERWEEEIERSALEAHPAVPPLLLELKRRGSRLVYISDFYLPATTLRRILDDAGIGGFFDGGYVSSTRMLRKASGRLFQHVLETEGVTAAEMLFVGDNLYADVDRANEAGIASVHLQDSLVGKRRFHLQLLGRLAAKNRYWRGALAHEIVENSILGRPEPDSAAYALGRKVAPAFVAFAEHVLEKASLEGFTAVYFCAREGALFHRMVRKLADADRDHRRLRYVGVSRRSTYLASMERLDHKELERFLRQYHQITGRQLVDSLSLPLKELEPALARAGVPLDQPIENALQSEALARLLSDAEVQAVFRRHRDEARRLLADYLRQKGYFREKRVLWVDIGWKGSIIDNVVRATAEIPGAPAVEGVLFGAQEDVTDGVCRKRGWFFHGPEKDPRASAPMSVVPLFEMHATANHGSAVGYERHPRGRVRVLTDYPAEERDNHRSHLEEGQRAVIDWFHAYLRVRPLLASTYDVSRDEWKPYLQEQIRRLVNYPTAREVEAFMANAHVESFGVRRVRRFAEEAPDLRAQMEEGRRVPKPSEVYKAVRFTVWPAAVLTRMKLGWLQPVYDVVDTWHRSHRW